jgi:hypothetical protein
MRPLHCNTPRCWTGRKSDCSPRTAEALPRLGRWPQPGEGGLVASGRQADRGASRNADPACAASRGCEGPKCCDCRRWCYGATDRTTGALDSESAPSRAPNDANGSQDCAASHGTVHRPRDYGLCPRSPVGGVRNCGVSRKRRALGHSQRMFVPTPGRPSSPTRRARRARSAPRTGDRSNQARRLVILQRGESVLPSEEDIKRLRISDLDKRVGAHARIVISSASPAYCLRAVAPAASKR